MIKVGNITIPYGLECTFSDNSLSIKLKPEELYIPEEENIVIEWLYQGDSELFTLICVKRHIDNLFPQVDVVLDMPYIPHARMDRVKHEEDVFTLKYFAEIINSLNFKMVWVRDAHSNVSLALINNVFEYSVQGYIQEAIELSKAEAVFYPDSGAMKRYSKKANLPYAFGMKRREWKTGKILGLDIVNNENVVDKDILIIDDICSMGGTVYKSAKALKAAGAKSISLYVTHLETTVTFGFLADRELIDHIYTTKSIFSSKLLEHEYWGSWITVLE